MTITDIDESANDTHHDPAQEVMMSKGEWKGLIDLLRAVSDGNPERALPDNDDRSAEYYLMNYADYIEERRRDWP